MPTRVSPTEPLETEPLETQPLETEDTEPLETAEASATAPPVAESDDAGPSLVSRSTSTSVAETPVLSQSTESLPDAQPDQSIEDQSSLVDQPCDGILDFQGLIRPLVVVIDDSSQPCEPSPAAPSSSAGSKGSRRAPSRITRRTPAVVPEALAAAASRKPTSPALISGKPRPATSSPTPMDATSELKRKAQTQTDTLPKEKKERKKKGRKQ